MKFDDALKKELKAIDGLNKRVYPVVAPEGVKPPFLVYRKSRGKYLKDLSGIITDVDCNYEIVLISDDYQKLNQIKDEIKKKLISKLFKRIGEDGPIVSNFDIEDAGDQYVYQPNAFKNNMLLTFNYKEE